MFTQQSVGSSLTELTIPQDLEFARYRVFVEANMPGGVVKKQDVGHTFVVDVKSLPVPVNATTATSPEFRFDRVAGASSYILFVNNPGNPVTETVADPGTGTRVSHTLSTALARNDYKWWVRPVREVQATTYLGPWSDASEFSTGGRTKLTLPERDSTATITIPSLNWWPVEGAQSYEIYVSQTGTPGALYRDPGITKPNIRARALANGEYSVWIRTTLADGSSVWGSGSSFTVNAASTGLQTTPVSPTTPTFDTTPTFTWQATAGATSYDVYVHQGTSSKLETGITGTAGASSISWTPTTALPAGVATWSVRPVNASGNGNWSTPIAFSTNGLTSLTSPGANTSDRTPRFAWQEVGGASTYEIQVNNQTTNTFNVIRQAGLPDPEFTPTTDLTLTPGTYRVWVRAISSSTTGPWSVQFDFVVATLETNEESEVGSLLLASLNPVAGELTQAMAPHEHGTLDLDVALTDSDENAGDHRSFNTPAVGQEYSEDDFAEAMAWLDLI